MKLAFFFLMAVASTLPSVARADAPTLEPKFSSISKNIFQNRCSECHGPDGSQSGIDIFSYAYLLDPTGPLVIAGKPEESELYKEVSTFDMPPGPRPHLTNAELGVIQAWINSGALNN
jgi:uncharacterized membrane protein